eukprot:m.41329 g.41329  ORF g.41329 m.41329 type:complete len:170 (+) comp10545_c0_seq2:2551-3060(+)
MGRCLQGKGFSVVSCPCECCSLGLITTFFLVGLKKVHLKLIPRKQDFDTTQHKHLSAEDDSDGETENAQTLARTTLKRQFFTVHVHAANSAPIPLAGVSSELTLRDIVETTHGTVSAGLPTRVYADSKHTCRVLLDASLGDLVYHGWLAPKYTQSSEATSAFPELTVYT